MIKTINISGRDVVFESNAALPILYKSQFKSDFYKDLIKLAKSSACIEDDPENTDWDSLEHLDLMTLYQVAWAMAKTHCRDIEPPLEWFSKFECFPVEALKDICELAAASISTKKK